MTAPPNQCQRCGAGFPGQMGKSYCSRRCKERARDERHATHRAGQPIPCRWCGQPFTRTHGAVRYCGPGCRWAGVTRRIRASGERHGRNGNVDLRIAYIPPAPCRYDAAYVDMLALDPCSYCGEQAGIIEHITVESQGGDNTTANLTAACPACNGAKNVLPLLPFLLVQRHVEDIDPIIEQIERLTLADYRNPRAADGATRQPRRLRRRARRLAAA